VSASPRRALVTGASSGIGEAVARVLDRAGYRLALLARREDKLIELRSQLADRDHIVLCCDLSQPDQIRSALDQVGEAFGGLDLLVNNAGIGYRALVEELEPEMLEMLLATNVAAPLLMCQASLPWLRQGSDPVVINIASVVGRRGVPGQAAYSASKAAICSIGEALRIEWADDGIAVCTLNPALTATGFFDAQANPGSLPDPDLTRADPTESVAEHVLALDRKPESERSLRWKWTCLGLLSLLMPRWSDRLLIGRLGGGWRVPER
jgi:NAD(P)-dependent dehydrogenase (short-subunit alcohol dehydrogenase family)